MESQQQGGPCRCRIGQSRGRRQSGKKAQQGQAGDRDKGKRRLGRRGELVVPQQARLQCGQQSGAGHQQHIFYPPGGVHKPLPGDDGRHHQRHIGSQCEQRALVIGKSDDQAEQQHQAQHPDRHTQRKRPGIEHQMHKAQFRSGWTSGVAVDATVVADTMLPRPTVPPIISMRTRPPPGPVIMLGGLRWL